MADAKQGKQSDDLYNGTQSRVILAKPKLGGFGGGGFASNSNKGNNPFGSLLRPAQLKPTSNPFAKVTEDSNTEPDKSEIETKPVDSTNDTNKDEEMPKFVPLGSANAAPRNTTAVPTPVTTATTTSSAGFVFGQNLSERVVIKEAMNNGELSQDHSSSNGTNDLLFTSAAATVKENHQDDPGPSESRTDSLAAAAAEYERSHARPPPATSNCTMTGEEGETNVLQVSCRLFAWESGSWRERGRGVLRLNDTECGGARLVARVAGSLRVVLNTKVWPDMVVDRAGTKSLRITAADAQLQIKLFLIMGAPSDITQLYRALQIRVTRIKSVSNCKDTSQPHAQPDGEPVDFDEIGKDVVHDSDQDDDDQDDIERLEGISEQKTETGDEIKDLEKESKGMKRKEPVEDTTSPKRLCQDVAIQ